jgi:hypothetical protein
VPVSPAPSTLADLGPFLGRNLRLPWFDVTDSRFGAKGDGVTDDTAAVQAALDAAHASADLGGAVVFLPLGTYKITATLLIYTNTVLRGAGWNSIIKATTAITMLMLTDPVSGTVQGVGIENLRITGGSSANGATGIQWSRYLTGAPTTSSRTNYLKSVEIDSCLIGLQLVNDQGIRVSACRFESNGIGVKASDNSELGVWEACDFRYNSTAGVVLENTNAFITPTSAQGIYGHLFNRCHWEANTGKGVVIDGAGSNTFNACKWEGNTGSSVELVTTNAATRPDVNTFVNCIWNGTPGSPTQLNVDLQRGSKTLFLGGSMCGSSTNGIVISSNVIDTHFIGTTFLDATKISDSSSSTWYLTSPTRVKLPGATNAIAQWIRFDTPSGTIKIGDLSPFVFVTNVRMQVFNAFNGTTPKVSVGTSGNNSFLCTATDVSTTGIKAPVLGTGAAYNDAVFQTINAYYTGGASTAGRCLCIVEFEYVPAVP